MTKDPFQPVTYLISTYKHLIIIHPPQGDPVSCLYLSNRKIADNLAISVNHPFGTCISQDMPGYAAVTKNCKTLTTKKHKVYFMLSLSQAAGHSAHHSHPGHTG